LPPFKLLDVHGRIVVAILNRVHGHVEARLLGAGNVEGGVATVPVALDAGSQALLLAHVAGESPASRGNGLD